MILSFHPCFEADKNIICAGRAPNKFDIKAIRKAKAVILPQGCTKELHILACQNCDNVFPNFDARFLYPGKVGQIKLFKSKNISHPESFEYNSLSTFITSKSSEYNLLRLGYPFIFKFDWGGEGETVFFVKTKKTFNALLEKAKVFEKSGHYGFLIQKYIKNYSKTLRVVVIGRKIISYWKVNQPGSKIFGEHLSSGSYIKKNIDPIQENITSEFVKYFCNKTKINLAGLDLIFSKNDMKPFLLEVNYFFGRQGLGGSEEYYKILINEIKNWIDSIK